MSLGLALILKAYRIIRHPPRALVRLGIFTAFSILLIFLIWKGSSGLSYGWSAALITEAEVKSIYLKAKEFKESPVKAPYKTTFWEVGQRSRELRKWLERADHVGTSSYAGRRLHEVVETTAQELFRFLKNPPRRPGTKTPLADLRRTFKKGSKGIVIPVGGGEQSVRFAGHLIVSLRKVLGSRLPIEIVYAGEDDLPKKDRDRIWSLDGATDIKFVDISTIFDDTTLKLKDGVWAIKPYAMLGSRFEEAILLDADAVFIQQPKKLFSQRAYKEKGSLLFHDRLLWQHAFKARHNWWRDQIKEPTAEMNKSLVWTEDYAEECDSGVIVLNKARVDTLVGLLHVAWQNTHEVREEVTYRLGHGDKESWWLGLELGGAQYEFEKHYGSMLGWRTEEGKVCSFVIAHTDEKDKLLWYNGSLLKNKRVNPEGYEVPEYWMMDGKWHKGKTKNDMSCMDGNEVLKLGDEVKQVLQESIDVAKDVDKALKRG